MTRVAASSLTALVIITVVLLGWRGGKSPDPPFQPFMDMVAQPRYNPQSESKFFADGRTQRMPPPHTVAWGRNGRQPDGSFAEDEETLFHLATMPVEISRDLLLRGQRQFRIFCVVCHGGTGAGDGITTEYAMNAPPAYHGDRVSKLTDGEIFQVITQGKGQMGRYGGRIKRQDRWAVVAYVRALQRAHHGSAADVPPQILARQRQISSARPSSTTASPNSATASKGDASGEEKK